MRDDIDVRRCPLTEAHKFVNKINLYKFKLKGPCYGWLGNSANYSSSDTGWDQRNASNKYVSRTLDQTLETTKMHFEKL